MQLNNRPKLLATTVAVLILLTVPVRATSITAGVFANGASVSSTSPDSVVFGDGSLWVAYQNGADSTGASGSSTVVRYNLSSSVVNTWTIAGNVDGLRIDHESN